MTAELRCSYQVESATSAPDYEREGYEFTEIIIPKEYRQLADTSSNTVVWTIVMLRMLRVRRS